MDCSPRPLIYLCAGGCRLQAVLASVVSLRCLLPSDPRFLKFLKMFLQRLSWESALTHRCANFHRKAFRIRSPLTFCSTKGFFFKKAKYIYIPNWPIENKTKQKNQAQGETVPKSQARRAMHSSLNQMLLPHNPCQSVSSLRCLEVLPVQDKCQVLEPCFPSPIDLQRRILHRSRWRKWIKSSALVFLVDLLIQFLRFQMF